MAIGYFYMTGQGQEIVEKLNRSFKGLIYDKTNYKEAVKKLWHRDNTLVFVMATGIVVRTIAPYIQSKTTDPAVLVVDQNGKFVISLLSGHLGGANAQTQKLAEVLDAVPVITTATDLAGVPAMDVVAKNNGLEIRQLENLKYVSSAMVEQRPLNVLSQWIVDGEFPQYVDVFALEEAESVCEKSRPTVIMGRPTLALKAADEYMKNDGGPVLLMMAKTYVIGTGCKKNMDVAQYETAFFDFIKNLNISLSDIAALATIDLKKDEMCIRSLAAKLNIPVIIYSKEDLERVDLNDASGQKIEASAFVESITGVGSVCEASAYLASGQGRILQSKTKYQGVTFALAEEEKVIRL